MDDLYRDRDLAARFRPASDSRRWVVTFDNYGGDRSLTRKGFGEDFLASQGVSAIHVIGAGNHWYQYAGMAAALVAIKDATAGASRVITYGSSMGAYAAVRFAPALGAHGVLALSPQYSIDPAKMPAEYRWQYESDTIAFRDEIDGAHVARINRDIAIEGIALPYIGHPSTTFLSMNGMLGPTLMAHAKGTLDIAALRQTMLAARKSSPVYLSELAGRQPITRAATAETLARRALAGAPTESLFHHRLALLLTGLGAHGEALFLHARAVELSGGYVGYVIPHAEALLSAGDAAGAVKVARGLVADDDNNPRLHSLLARALWAMGEVQAARTSAARALALDPGNNHYVLQHEGYMPPLAGRVERARRRAMRWLRRRGRRK